MQINKVVFIFLSALTLIASANELPRNKSSVQMKGTALSKTPGECTGLAHYTAAIFDIGLSEKQFKDPHACIWGDFDGNGFIDIAIWGALTESPGYVGTRKFKVLFFEEGRIIKSQIIENANKDTLLLYPNIIFYAACVS